MELWVICQIMVDSGRLIDLIRLVARISRKLTEFAHATSVASTPLWIEIASIIDGCDPSLTLQTHTTPETDKEFHVAENGNDR